MKIKIYGERNCGTNYLEKLIASNLNAEILNFRVNTWSGLLLKSIKFDGVQDILWRLQRQETLGWKHGCAPVREIKAYDSDSLMILTITKNPYSFLHSLYKNPYHQKGKKSAGFSDFIRQKWTTRGRDLCHKKYLNSPMDLWNIKNWSYVALKSQTTKHVINLSYESLIKNPEKCIRRIAATGNIAFLRSGKEQFQNYLKSTKDSQQTHEDYKAYYLEEKWKSQFNQTDLTYLNAIIDPDLLDYFGYGEVECGRKQNLQMENCTKFLIGSSDSQLKF